MSSEGLQREPQPAHSAREEQPVGITMHDSGAQREAFAGGVAEDGAAKKRRGRRRETRVMLARICVDVAPSDFY